VLELDRVLDESPEKLAAYRRGQTKNRQTTREPISAHTERLLARVGAAGGTANPLRLLHRASSEAVIVSGNRVAARVHDSTGGSGSSPASSPGRRDGSGDVAEMAATAIEKTREAEPIIATRGSGSGLREREGRPERGTTKEG
jgi:hypothetical protein